jgi:hypothetical protein
VLHLQLAMVAICFSEGFFTFVLFFVAMIFMLSASLHFFSQLCVAFIVKYWLQFVCPMKVCAVLCLG